MQAIPAQPLTANATITIDLQAANTSGNAIQGAVLQNLSGFNLVVNCNGGSWSLPAGINDFIPLVGITGGTLVINVGATNSAPNIPNPILTGTIYNTSETVPGGYPMVNPGYLQAPITGASEILATTVPITTGGPLEYVIATDLPVAGSDLVLIEEWATGGTIGNRTVGVTWSDANNNLIGNGVQWDRLAAVGIIIAQHLFVPQGPFMNINLWNQSAANYDALFFVYTIPQGGDKALIIPNQTIIVAHGTGLPASGTVNLLPIRNLGAGRYHLWANSAVASSARVQYGQGDLGNVSTQILLDIPIAGASNPDANIDFSMDGSDFYVEFFNNTTTASTCFVTVIGPND